MAGRDDPRVTVRLAPELRDAMAAAAAREGKSLGAWITGACERALPVADPMQPAEHPLTKIVAVKSSPSAASGKASVPGEGPVSSREPNVMVLAAAMGTRDVSAARRALADGSWKKHMK